MNKPTLTQLGSAITLTCLLQSCAIPATTSRVADPGLPAQYAQATTDGSSAATIDWSSWFEDQQLKALIDIALTNNQELAMLLQRIGMAANEVDARKGEYLPFVDIGVVADVDKVGRYTRNGAVEEQLHIREHEAFPDPLRNLQAGLHASWELDVWKKLRTATQAAALEYLASLEGRNLLTTVLVAEVANSYFELLALDNQLANLDQNLDIQRNALDVTRELLNFGRTTSLAVTRFEAEVRKNESERYAIQQDIVATENRLNLLLGRTPQPIARASDSLLQLEPKQVSAGLPAELLANRPDIRRAELELQAAALDIKVARANFYPSFALKAGVGLEAFDQRYLLETPASLMYGLSADMIAPLINRRAIAAELRNASAAQVEAAYEYELTVLTAFSEVSTQLSALDKLSRNYALKQQQVDALNSSVEVAGQLFASARADYLEVLLAQREALEARSELIDTKQQQLSAMVDLYRALGGGWQSGQL